MSSKQQQCIAGGGGGGLHSVLSAPHHQYPGVVPARAEWREMESTGSRI